MIGNDAHIGPAIWWSADGRILYANRDDPQSEQSNFGINSVQVNEENGKAIGEPQPVTKAEGDICGINGSSDGKRVVLWRTNFQLQTFITEFDAASQKWKAPRRLTLDANANVADAWTADSKAVLFVSNRNNTWKLFKQRIDETTAQVLAEGRSIFLPRLSGDGSQVLYLVSSARNDPSFPATLMRKPLAGGPSRVFLEEEESVNHQCARAPATLCIVSRIEGREAIFYSFDLEHGMGRELLRIPLIAPRTGVYLRMARRLQSFMTGMRFDLFA